MSYSEDIQTRRRSIGTEQEGEIQEVKRTWGDARAVSGQNS